MESYINTLSSYFKESEMLMSRYIVYLDMDGVIADFDKEKETFIMNDIRDELIQKINNPILTEEEINHILEDLIIGNENPTSLVSRNKYEILKETYWNLWIKAKKFETLPTIQNNKLVKELYELKRLHGFKLGILSSVTSNKEANLIKEMKMNWLIDNDVYNYLDSYFIIFVEGKSLKSKRASANTILIDDLVSNCNEFKAHGGNSIFYNRNNHEQAITNTINKVKQILNIEQEEIIS